MEAPEDKDYSQTELSQPGVVALMLDTLAAIRSERQNSFADLDHTTRKLEESAGKKNKMDTIEEAELARDIRNQLTLWQGQENRYRRIDKLFSQTQGYDFTKQEQQAFMPFFFVQGMEPATLSRTVIGQRLQLLHTSQNKERRTWREQLRDALRLNRKRFRSSQIPDSIALVLNDNEKS